MYNKNQYRKTNNKYLLHKIGKQWVTISIAMLALLGGSFAMKSVTTHADTITPNVKAQSANPIKTQLNKNLDRAYSAGVQNQSTQATNSNESFSSNSVTNNPVSSSATKPSHVESVATNLHQNLVTHTLNNNNNSSISGFAVKGSNNSNIKSSSANLIGKSANSSGSEINDMTQSSSVSSSSANNSDNNASTPNYIENHIHYNLDSYNARQSQSTESQKDAYANYLKQNPQLVHTYNETANQSNMNNVTTTVPSKRHNDRLLTDTQATYNYTIKPQLRFVSGKDGHVINQSQAPDISGFQANAQTLVNRHPGEQVTFNINKFCSPGNIGNDFTAPTNTLTAVLGNNGQYNWLNNNNTFIFTSKPAGTITVNYQDAWNNGIISTYKYTDGYVDDVLQASNHVPSGYSINYNNGAGTGTSLYSSNPKTVTVPVTSNPVEKDNLPINVNIVNSDGNVTRSFSSTASAKFQTDAQTWDAPLGTWGSGSSILKSQHIQFLNYNGWYSGYNDPECPGVRLNNNLSHQGYVIVNSNNDLAVAVDGNNNISWQHGVPTVTYIKNSPRLYSNIKYNFNGDELPLPFPVYGGKTQYYAPINQPISVPVNSTDYNNNPYLNAGSQDAWFFNDSIYTPSNTQPLQVTLRQNGNGQITYNWANNDNTVHLVPKFFQIRVNYYNSANNQLIKADTATIKLGIWYNCSVPDYVIPGSFTQNGQPIHLAYPKGYEWDPQAEHNYKSAWTTDDPLGNPGATFNTYVKPTKHFYTIWRTVNGQNEPQTYSYYTGEPNSLVGPSGSPVNYQDVPSPWNTNFPQLLLNFYDDSKPQDPSHATNIDQIDGYPLVSKSIDTNQNGTLVDLDSYLPSGYRIDNENMDVPDVYEFGQATSHKLSGSNTVEFDVPIEPIHQPASDAINNASSLINSDLTKVQYLASADANDKFATNQINSINGDVNSIKADINAINADRATENSSNANNEIASANNAYDNAYSANANIESLMNTSLSTDSSEINSLNTLANNNSKAITNIQNADNSYNAYQTSLNNLSNEANSIEDLNLNNGTALKSQIDSMEGSLNNASNAIKWVQSSSSAITDSLEDELISPGSTNSTVINSLERASNATSGDLSRDEHNLFSAGETIDSLNTRITNLSTSANANHTADSIAINHVKNELSNYDMVSADAVNAMSSLNADKSALSYLVNNLGSVKSEATQASSNAVWIHNNSASVSALSNEWTSVNGQISNDSKALDDAINTKADQTSLNNDYSKLSGDISIASGLANTANQLANKDSGKIDILSGSANTAINTASANASNSVSSANSAINSLATSTSSSINALSSSASRSISDASYNDSVSASSAYSQATSDAKSASTSASTSISHIIGSLDDHINNSINSLSNSAKGSLSNATSVASASASSAYSNASSYANSLSEQASNSIAVTTRSTNNSIANASAKASNSVRSLSASTSTSLDLLSKSASNSIAKESASASKGIYITSASASASLSSESSSASSAISSASSAITSSTSSSMTKLSSSASNGIAINTGMIVTTSGQMHSNTSNLSNMTANLATSASYGIASNASNININADDIKTISNRNHVVKSNKNNRNNGNNRHSKSVVTPVNKHFNRHQIKQANYTKQSSLKYIIILKPIWLHTSMRFTKHNKVGKILKAHKIAPMTVKKVYRVNGHVRLMVRFHHHNYFITGQSNYVNNAYIQPKELKHYKHIRIIRGAFMHRSYHYTKKNRVRFVRKGKKFRIKHIKFVAKGVTRIQLTNGYWFTANRKFIKLIK